MFEQNNRLFLETTIQIDRFSADRDKTDKINKMVSQSGEILSSTYVKMEYRRRLVQDLVYLFNEALLDAETFADVFLRIDKLHSDYHKRKIKGMIAGFCRFFSDIKEDEISKPLGKGLLEKAIKYFRQTVFITWDVFEKDIDTLLNETDCHHAKTGPILKGEKFDNRMQRCKKSNVRCKIIDFFIQNKEAFKKIYEKISQLNCLDKEQQKNKNVLAKALKNPQIIADQQNCWNCGDPIIAVESPDDAVLLTTNLKHFEPICSSIGGNVQSPNTYARKGKGGKT